MTAPAPENLGSLLQEVSDHLNAVSNTLSRMSALIKEQRRPTQQSEEYRHRYNQAMILREFAKHEGQRMTNENFLTLAQLRGFDRRGMAGWYATGWVRKSKTPDLVYCTRKGMAHLRRFEHLLPPEFEALD